MKTLPRHLLLAAVVLTVCCAQRQAVSGQVPKLGQDSSQRICQTLSFEQIQVRRNARHLQVRPALRSLSHARRQAFVRPASFEAPVCPVVHRIYPPSRFRLPPPGFLA